jgi:hypothetical protein
MLAGGVLTTKASIIHALPSTGFLTQAVYHSPVLSVPFNQATLNIGAGVSINPGVSAAWFNTLTVAKIENLLP